VSKESKSERLRIVGTPAPRSLKTREYRCSSAVLLFRDVKKGSFWPFLEDGGSVGPIDIGESILPPPKSKVGLWLYRGVRDAPFFGRGSILVKMDQI
jgi:hypothetical protein